MQAAGELRQLMTDELNASTLSVPKLVEQWRQGDQDAATALYNRYQSRLLMLVSGHLNEKAAPSIGCRGACAIDHEVGFSRNQRTRHRLRDETGFWKWLVTSP